MELLAASRSEAAAGAVGLAAMMSCLLLMLYRPRRTVLADTPHQVPAVAFAVAVGWIIMVLALSSWSGGKSPDDSAAQPELSPAALWVLCVASVVEIVVVGAAYLLPRAYAAARVPNVPTISGPVDSVDQVLDSMQAASDLQAKARFQLLPKVSMQDVQHHLAVGMTVGFAALLPTGLMAVLIQPDRTPDDVHLLLKALANGGWQIVVPVVVAASVLAPLKEELLFRVVLQGWMSDRLGWLAIPLTALAFAGVHSSADAPLLLPLALILGLLYASRRSYLEVVAAHATFNAANIFAALNQ